jgi:Fe-S-cluster-containing dehydrogenase component/anaerobic selenocysteine-containing dehydrogenase
MNEHDGSFVPLESLAGGQQASDTETRRRFLELMGASLGMMGAAGCTRMPTQFIMPYVEPPEQAIPGRPSYYATARLMNGVAEGVVVETHLGRPTKVEGNPTHPASLGATDVHGQSCILDLYDPDRAQRITEAGESREWEEFLLSLGRALAPLRQSGGAGLFVLTETVTSPSLGAQIEAVQAAFPNARWHSYDPAGAHSARTGAGMAFGRPVNVYYRLDRATVIVALESNFLACGAGSTRYAHDFIMCRRVRGSNVTMNRLYAVETEMTSTGGKADHRLPLRPGEIESFARELAATVAAGGAARAGSPHAGFIGAVARDLLDHRGASAIVAGEHASPAVHALAHTMNAALGNTGNTVIYTDPIELGPADQIASLRDLTGEMEAGNVRLLLILGGNPVYNAPPDFGFASALAKVPVSVHVSLDRNETSALSRWTIPQRHFFEDWGDARSFDGTVTILQPLIEPLYDGRSFLEVLDAVVRQPSRSSYEIVRSYWAAHAGAGDFETWWRHSVQSGVVAGSSFSPITSAPHGVAPPQAPATESPGGLDILFRTDPYIYDGRFANNAWLQELPKPITKLMWDNAVHLSPATARRLGLENQHRVEVAFRGNSVQGSVWISPGQADETVVLHLGYGRTHVGRVGKGAGFNAYSLRRSDALWSGTGAEVRAIGGSYPLAQTQMHQMGEEGREMVISEPVGVYERDPDFARKRIETPDKRDTLYPQWNYTGYAWGMAIDLTACVNCMACVIACQAENNIPVVGKEQQLFNREMHWLRVDVYYKNGSGGPSARYQPVPCMHCEDAPCEYVCPVAATTHSSDGLNEMTYNRCIGTRYCSNNCPYKVRRFNFLLFNDWITEQLKLQRNPDVTVRSRGVMEKCTYCVQRIREAEIRATDEGRYIRDGEIQTACQQVCPTKAIMFGDINNSANQVAKWKAEKLNYALLAELNTRPRTTYLAELRNPNPEIKEVAGS